MPLSALEKTQSMSAEPPKYKLGTYRIFAFIVLIALLLALLIWTKG